MTRAGRSILGACSLLLALGGAACDDGSSGAEEREPEGSAGCDVLPDADELREYVRSAPDSVEAGGLFHGQHEWAAVVNRKGVVCAVVAAHDTLGGHWPGSRTIAMAKAFTANGFSVDAAPMSTARLYTMAQPGHSLYGAFVANPFNPECLKVGHDAGEVCGGTIVFGGGLPLYSAEGQVIGGLGVSGDTPCADHEVAKIVRALSGLIPPGGNYVDDITYAVQDAPSPYTHPLCLNTYRNGVKLGDPPPQPSYGMGPPPPEPGPPPGPLAPSRRTPVPDTSRAPTPDTTRATG